VLRLPQLLDHELRRLPPADPGQLAHRAPQVRGRLHAQLRDLQPAGHARRHLHAGQARHDQGPQGRTGTLVLGAGAFVPEHQPRAHLHPAAADFVRGLQLAGDGAALPAHGAPRRDQDLHRLPFVEGERQQRDHRAAAGSRDQVHRLHGLQRLGGRRRRDRGRARHGVGRAAGCDRQLPAALRLPGLLQEAPGRGTGAADRRGALVRHRELHSDPRRVRVRVGRRQGHARLRRGQRRQQGLLAERSSRRRSRRSGRTRASRPRMRPAWPWPPPSR
jgi:hypothetical protein